jgi:hypothetical protein
MSASMFLVGDEYGALEIEASDDAIWVRERRCGDVIALTLDRAHRARLRAALDKLDAAEVPDHLPADLPVPMKHGEQS